MLLHPHDAPPSSDDRWRHFLATHDFGQLIAPGGPTRNLLVVVATHFVWDGDATVRPRL